MQGFEPPDFQAPLDLKPLLDRIPAQNSARGILFATAVRAVKARTDRPLARRQYHALSSYPGRELLEVLVEAAQLAFPEVPLREGLRRLGHQVFPAIKGTAAGTFLFSVAGNNVRAALGLVSRAYALFGSDAKAELSAVADDTVIVELRNVWSFADCYHVGIFEGGAVAFGNRATVTVRRLSDCDTDLCIGIH